MLSLLSRWTRPRQKFDVAHLEVTVYTREQCCCCHKALDLLREYQPAHRFTIETVDVDTDPTLIARYGHEVPVVAVGGKVRFRGVVNPALFERLLVAESRNR
jgi:glutaredoxin